MITSLLKKRGNIALFLLLVFFAVWVGFFWYWRTIKTPSFFHKRNEDVFVALQHKPGKTVFLQNYELSAQVNGKLKTLLIQEGEKVGSGQLLIEIEDEVSYYQVQVESFKREWEKAQELSQQMNYYHQRNIEELAHQYYLASQKLEEKEQQKTLLSQELLEAKKNGTDSEILLTALTQKELEIKEEEAIVQRKKLSETVMIEEYENYLQQQEQKEQYYQEMHEGLTKKQENLLILAPYDAVIQKIFVQAGDEVARGDLLLSLAQSQLDHIEVFLTEQEFLKLPTDKHVVLGYKGEYYSWSRRFAHKEEGKEGMVKIIIDLIGGELHDILQEETEQILEVNFFPEHFSFDK